MPSISGPLVAGVTGLLGDVGVGAATAATIGSIAGPALLDAGLGAGLGALTGGNIGTGALLGGIGGALGPSLNALGIGTGAGTTAGALASAAPGALNSLSGPQGTVGTVAGTGAPATSMPSGTGTSPLGSAPVSIPGAVTPTSTTAGKIPTGLAVPTALLMTLLSQSRQQQVPSPTVSPAANFSQPFTPTGALNRTASGSSYTPSTGNYYTYGNQPEPQFFQNNQLGGLAHGGALSRMIAAHERRKRVAMGDGVFASGGGDHLVRGDGGGQQDNIPAKLSPGEWVADANFVSAIGDGNNEEGSKRLYAMRREVMHDKGMKHDVPPKLKKSPAQYLRAVA